MSIKKDIEAALRDGGTVQLNGVSYLYRWKEDWKGDQVDGLEVVFKYVCGVRGGKRYDLVARDYDGIIAEVSDRTKDYFAEVADTLGSNLSNGYRS